MKRILKWIFRIVLVLFILAFLFVFIAYWRSTNDCDQLTVAQGDKMKAIIYCDYGLANLKLAEVAKPTPTDDQILVKVHAASVNPLDWHFIEGTPKIMRALGVGLRKPKDARLGVDFAGTVETVGKNVTQFKAGDEVFGGRDGAFAEYVCPRADRAVTQKPANITFEQAASVNIAGITALQALRDKGKVQPGQKVLINGASGGVGTFAVQIAKSFGADVTGVCSTRNLEMVRSLGADHVIDYTKEDFTKTDQRYDMIYDLVGNHGFSERRKILKPNGICVLAGIGGAGAHPETMGRIVGNFWNAFRSNFSKEKFVFYIAKLTKGDFGVLHDLMQSGKVSPVIDRTYKLEQTADAVRYMEEGHARGKVVVKID
jgi:NADPH:quinone reductase-like Zn-dependent oxidoreductase